jgi:hypothetical protein
LQFNLNPWHSRAKHLAGSLAATQLPASASIKSVEVHEAVTAATHKIDDSLEAVRAGL